MGYQESQRLPDEVDPSSYPSEPPPPYRPPLPPRDSEPASAQGLSSSQRDPRNASTDSLAPADNKGSRRKLLIVYIHGFLGDETSFQSFPAHVHNVVTPLLERSHVVHTKIYPRYRSRKHITYARDDFSNWISPHEPSDTDVILCGHSMGGLLSAEVALMPKNADGSGLKHRVIGTVNLDVPFLGMHPGVISSGLSSVFRPAPKASEGESGATSLNDSDGNYAPAGVSSVHSPTASPSTRSSVSGAAGASEKDRQTPNAESSSVHSFPLSPGQDPNFNPAFTNDSRLAVRSGWEGPLHFVKKHSNDLLKASKTYVTSHLEFGGAMADYPALKRRYEAIRKLDAEDENAATGRRRVRFINYYTASTGRPKPPKHTPSGSIKTAEPGEQSSVLAAASTDDHTESPTPGGYAKDSEAKEPSPSAADVTPVQVEAAQTSEKDVLESPRGAEEDGLETEDPPTPGAHLDRPMTELIPDPIQSDSPEPSLKTPSLKTPSLKAPSLPPVPDEPIEPEPIEPSQYEDKDSRKLAEKEHARRTKAYKQAVKDREKAIKDRQKLVEKRQKQAQKDEAKKAADEKKQLGRDEAKKAADEKKQLDRDAKAQAAQAKQEKAAAQAAESATRRGSSASAAPSEEAEVATGDLGEAVPASTKKRDRKFCLLPPRRLYGGADAAWVRVYMEGVDEVGAHCGLFFTDRPHYEGLVLDVGEKMAEWAGEAEEARVGG